MSILQFNIDATQAEFDDFANRLGYQESSFDENDLPIPNPETRNAFLVRVLKERVASVFYTPFVTEIEQQVNTTRETDKDNIRDVVRARVTGSLT